jgi:tetratricopeptide (TPR) repeat protein
MLTLPAAPADQQRLPVKAWLQPVTMPTYEPADPDRNPMFLEKRVYQGSSGRVYPLPYYDRIAERPVERPWKAVHLENEYVRLMILPELGGRIHVGYDKTIGYDFFYRQNVIKPALVGLAGPWCSGGVEFNWPQHHRPATFMPVEVEIERADDGSVTVWCSDHDPVARMKGMHGVRLRPGSSAVELIARLHNRTEDAQTFLWWANVATRVHDQYQSFFPPDVSYVADHAKRAMSTFPRCEGTYYGVDYGSRTGRHADGVARNDLSWYRNIPVPTSYMILGTQQDFFGGYDHAAGGGLVHVADHHVSPGKKQWTWGNHPFGYAWDRNLTDGDGPYIELMAGVFTDNQPDFSWLLPGETKTFVQRWWPLQKIGVAHLADEHAALHLGVDGRTIRVGVAAAHRIPRARIELRHGAKLVRRWTTDLAPGTPLVADLPLPARAKPHDLELAVVGEGVALAYRIAKPGRRPAVPAPATEPPAPADIPSADELYITGLHLEQYRHATRSPVPYWQEALRRDPGDSRCNLALGRWHRCRGELALAEPLLRASVERQTRRNPNPADGEAFYQLGLCLRDLGRIAEGYDACAKAAWNAGWAAPAHLVLAELDCRAGAWGRALEHLDQTLRHDAHHLRARNLRALVLRRRDRHAEADASLADTATLDPLDAWCRLLRGEGLACDTQTRLDLALDHARAGFLAEAQAVLADAAPEPFSGTAPLVAVYQAWIADQQGDAAATRRALAALRRAKPDYCFPARPAEEAILRRCLELDGGNARTWHYLGNWLYDRRRHAEGIAAWERAARRDPSHAVTWRNLGIGRYNVLRAPAHARAAYDAAVRAAPDDARLLFERDQLWKRLGVPPRRRLAAIDRHPVLIARRDDLSVERANLLCQVGRFAEAEALLAGRRFQPWEGGEGQALAAHKRVQVALGRQALAAGDAIEAGRRFVRATEAPENLGEAWHLLQNQSDAWFWQGEAAAAAGDLTAATAAWQRAATFRGDFQDMSVRAYSEMSVWSALSLMRLGRAAEGRKLLAGLERHARGLLASTASIDYFATSLPTMLLFDDDIQERQTTTARFLQAQAALASGRVALGRRLLRQVLRRDPAHALAGDLAATGLPVRMARR